MPARYLAAAARLREAAGGAWAAARLRAPLILERPGINPEGTWDFSPYVVFLDEHGRVCISCSHWVSPIVPSGARRLAAVIAAYADAAEESRRAGREEARP